MATKGKPTKKNPHRQKPRVPANHLEQLREQSRTLSNISQCSVDVRNGPTVHDVLEDITKALTPLHYLRCASVRFQEHISEEMVSGYLAVFLTHMDEILFDLEMVARKLDQEKPAA